MELIFRCPWAPTHLLGFTVQTAVPDLPHSGRQETVQTENRGLERTSDPGVLTGSAQGSGSRLGSVVGVLGPGLTPGPWGRSFWRWDPVAHVRIAALTLMSNGRLHSAVAKQQHGDLLPHPSKSPAFF